MKRATRTQHDAILRRLERGKEAHRHDTEVRLINAIVAQTGATRSEAATAARRILAKERRAAE